MKKGICILLSSAMLMGTVPVYGNTPVVEQVTQYIPNENDTITHKNGVIKNPVMK